MARRATYLEGSGIDCKTENVLLLDSGDFSDVFSENGRERTACLMEIYGQWKVSALNVGLRELSGNIEFIENLAKEKRLQLVSANIFSEQNDSARFNQYISFSRNDKKIAVLGVVREVKRRWELDSGEVLITKDPFEILPELVDLVSKNHDIIILLAHFPKRELDNLLAACEGIDVVLGGDGYSVTREKEQTRGALLSYVGKDGRNISVIKLKSTLAESEYILQRLEAEIEQDEEIKSIVDGYLERDE